MDLAAGGPDLLHHAPLGRLEGADELPADDLALGLGVLHPRQRRQEPLGLVDGDDADAHAPGVVMLDNASGLLSVMFISFSEVLITK